MTVINITIPLSVKRPWTAAWRDHHRCDADVTLLRQYYLDHNYIRGSLRGAAVTYDSGGSPWFGSGGEL
jgi:hypothetical protein